MPDMDRNVPGFSTACPLSRCTALYRMSSARVDFPDPETPVTQVILPRGILTSISFKLWAAAP